MNDKYNRRDFLGLSMAGFATLVSCGKSEDKSPTDKSTTKNQILNLYDNISEEGQKAIPDWGFSAFIQYNGKTILYDAGTHPDVLEYNAKILGADLTEVDFAVLSHDHIDHLDGFDYLLKVNTDFKFYLPHDVFLGANYYESDKKYMRGYRYRHQNTEFINEHTEVAPGAFLIATTSPLTGRFSKYPPYENEPRFIGLAELSLALENHDGSLSVISGCSHSRIEEIVKTTKDFLDKRVSLVVGGFHHLPYSNEYIRSIATMMKDELEIMRVAPTHCTGEKSINIFKDLYKEDFHYFGLGATLSL